MTHVPLQEMQLQQGIAQRIQPQLFGKKYHIVTYGCQMNAHESETMSGILESMGLVCTEQRMDADVLLFNTCCIRENAEKRLFGNIGRLRKHKELLKQELIVGICGCMMQQEVVAQRLLKRYPFVDFVIGTHGIHTLPAIVERAIHGRVNAVEVDERIAEGLPVRRLVKHSALLSIMYGCDNYCAYCIVPYVRGRERSRDAKDILQEAQSLAQDGVAEITLLGQNVNSFQGGMSFAKLLRELDGVVPNIRFMSSHPKDLSRELLETMASCSSVCHQLHLPVQSGSDTVLERMNRGYTASHYRSIVANAREIMPDIGVSSDFIVGFPGETHEEFLQTMELTQDMRFDAAFTFAFSKRDGTKAATMQDQIPQEIKDERLQQLLSLQMGIQKEIYTSLVGTHHEVLIDALSKSKDGVSGKIKRGITVNILEDSPETYPMGTIQKITINQAKNTTLQAVWRNQK